MTFFSLEHLDYWKVISLCKKLFFKISFLSHNKSTFCLETLKQQRELRMESAVSQPSCLSPSPSLSVPCVLLAFSLSVPESHITPPNLHLCKHKWTKSLF